MVQILLGRFIIPVLILDGRSPPGSYRGGRRRNECVLFLELLERDYKILATLYLFRISTASQLGELYFPSVNAARERLRQLEKLNYINSSNFSTGERRWIKVYSLTRAGQYEARYWLERTYKRVLPDLSASLNRTLYNHELLMIDVFVNLVKDNLLKVDDLFEGRFIESRLAPVLPNVFKKRKTLRADARFQYEGVNIWLEIDRETERTSIIEEKLKSYQMFFASNSNSGERHTVLFLVDGKIDGKVDWTRINKIRELSCQYLGPDNNLGKVKWYTLPFDDLDFVLRHLIQPYFFKECIRALLKNGLYKQSMVKQVAVFDPSFLPTANTAACWLGFKDNDSDYEQFYIVENIVGGESGALQRLSYFGMQYSEFFNKYKGRKIKLIVLINDPRDLIVIHEMYPALSDRMIYISVPELLSGQCKVLIAREENR